MAASQSSQRRRYSVEFKLGLVKASREPGACVATVSIRSGVNPNLLHRWRKESDAGVVWRGSGDPAGKYRYPAQYKQNIIEQCLRFGETSSQIALANGISPKVVQHWIRQARQERAAEFLPVRLSQEDSAPLLTGQELHERIHGPIVEAPSSAPAPMGETESGQIVIELGGARIQWHGTLGLKALRVAIEALRR
jgi:transposase-like protein